MGPRPSGRGTPPSTCAATRTSCVNGAAAEWPRNGSWPPGRSQWQSSVNGAAAEWPRNVFNWQPPRTAPAASMGPRPSGRGTEAPEGGSRLRCPASMGPRPSGRGTMGLDKINAPVGKRQWGRGRVAAERTRLADRYCTQAVRQWGRGRVAAERAITLDDSIMAATRQWGRGRVAAERCRWARPRP